MHDVTDRTHWHEPKAGENAGLEKFKRPREIETLKAKVVLTRAPKS